MFPCAGPAGVLFFFACFGEMAPSLALEASERVLLVLEWSELEAVVAESVLDEFVGCCWGS